MNSFSSQSQEGRKVDVFYLKSSKLSWEAIQLKFCTQTSQAVINRCLSYCLSHHQISKGEKYLPSTDKREKKTQKAHYYFQKTCFGKDCTRAHSHGLGTHTGPGLHCTTAQFGTLIINLKNTNILILKVLKFICRFLCKQLH